MKLIRHGSFGGESPGICIDGVLYDTSGIGEDYNEQFFATGGLARLRHYIAGKENKLEQLPPGIRLGSPVARPSKIICIGLNYADHAKETGAATPPEPVIFMKSTTSLCGPYDDVILPRDSVKTDWEVELAVVIEKKASYVNEENAMDHVAGYSILNDLSEREFQMERNGTWDKGKGCDSFGPMGPWLVTKDEVPDVNDLSLWLKVNGRMMQDGRTSNLIFKIPFLVSYVSNFMTLLPGDIISTGTPAGVGLGMNPQVYLKYGDVIELGIDGLGTAKQKVKSHV